MARHKSPVPEKRSLVFALVILALLLAGAAVFLAGRIASGPRAPSAHAFMTDCVWAATPHPQRCGSFDAIRSRYGIDAAELIERRHNAMMMTARRLVSGELRDPARYQDCIRRGECTTIPLLPAGVKAADVAGTDQHMATRTAFWQLARGRNLTPEVCAFMDICRALHQSGAMTFFGENAAE